MIKIEFIKDFATRKKGEAVEVDGMLASQLIARKVAKKWKPKQRKRK